MTVVSISTLFSTFNRLRFSHLHSIFQLELVALIWSTAIDRARLQSRITPRLGPTCLASPVPIKGHIILRDKQITRHIQTTISSAGNSLTPFPHPSLLLGSGVKSCCCCCCWAEMARCRCARFVCAAFSIVFFTLVKIKT